MKSLKKPTIVVGYALEADFLFALEVCYGIEEEGCLPEVCQYKNTSDAALIAQHATDRSITGVAVGIYANKAEVHCLELKKERSLLCVFSEESNDYRQLGKNAARYLKNKKLDL